MYMKFEIFVMTMICIMMIFCVVILYILIGVTSVSEEHITSIPSSGFLKGGFHHFRETFCLLEPEDGGSMFS
jgi:hypothetical protein